MKGTVKDPTLDRRTVYLRWFVLETLLPLPTNGRGTGAKLSALELLELYRKAPRSFDDVSAKELGQAARHFALPQAGERCLYWVNADRCTNPDATFGISREGREAAEGLAAAYGGRLAALELAEVPHDGFQEPEAPEDIEEVELVARVPAAVADDLRCGRLSALSMGARVEDRAFDERLGYSRVELSASDRLLAEVPHDGFQEPEAPLSASDRLAEAPAPAPDVAYTERQGTPGLDRQGAGRGARNDRDDPDATLAQFAVKAVPPGPWEAKELEEKRNALRYNIVWDERGNRIPGVRFAPAFKIRGDGSIEWMSIAIVPFREDPTKPSDEE
jgi:hypothetical protein